MNLSIRQTYASSRWWPMQNDGWYHARTRVNGIHNTSRINSIEFCLSSGFFVGRRTDKPKYNKTITRAWFVRSVLKSCVLNLNKLLLLDLHGKGYRLCHFSHEGTPGAYAPVHILCIPIGEECTKGIRRQRSTRPGHLYEVYCHRRHRRRRRYLLTLLCETSHKFTRNEAVKSIEKSIDDR